MLVIPLLLSLLLPISGDPNNPKLKGLVLGMKPAQVEKMLGEGSSVTVNFGPMFAYQIAQYRGSGLSVHYEHWRLVKIESAKQPK